MRLPAEQLDKHLKSGLRSAYLVAGDEPLLVLEAVDQLRQAARVAGASDRLVFDVMPGFDWGAWRMTSRSLGLFSTRRLLEVRMTSAKVTNEGSAALAEFVNDPGDDVLLVSVPDWSKTVEGQAWVEALEQAGVVVPIRPLPVNEQPRWIQARARQLGVQLSEDAQLELVALVEGNLLAAHQELYKLSLLAPGQTIDAVQLLDLVADSTRYDVFGLFDAVLAGQPERVRRILAGLRGEGIEPASLCGYLVSQIQALAGAEEARAQGMRLSSYWPGARVYGQRQAQFERALGRDWTQRLREAGRVDLTCKGRGSGLPWVELERWLLRASLPRGPAARYAA